MNDFLMSFIHNLLGVVGNGFKKLLNAIRFYHLANVGDNRLYGGFGY